MRRLLAHGAEPNLRDSEHRTALDRCRAGRRNYLDHTGHDQVEAILEPLTMVDGGSSTQPT